MICTRWPACTSFQSSSRASGKYSRSEAMRSSWLSISWPIRYWLRSKLSMPALNIGPMLPLVTEPGRSHSEPFFRNLVEKVANGPNSRTGLPSIMRVSRCGTDIGGEPTEALP